MIFALCLSAGAAGLAADAATAAAVPEFTGPIHAGDLAAPPRQETSGLAASRRNPGILWTHDDSGGAAALYAVRTTGESVGVLHLKGEKNEDWEDLAAFELDGKPWLLIADTGDNDAERATVRLHLIEEPALDPAKSGIELSARPTRTLRVRYEDGPRDCEAVAVDAAERAIYLLTKREDIPRLYRVPLEPPAGEEITIARHVAQVSHIPQPTKKQSKEKGYLGKRRAEVTALDFSADGTMAVVLTYGSVLLYPRRGREPWAETLAREPVLLPANDMVQVEAACFSVDGKHLFIAAEKSRALVRYDRK